MTHQPHLSRRSFLAASSAAAAAGLSACAHTASPPDQPVTSHGMAEVPAAPVAPGQPDRPGDAHRGPCLIASANGLRSVELAAQLITQGSHPLDAIVQGVQIIENDPSDMSVGYGGLPNEEGIVELDASVMDGPLHRAGSVGALRNIKNPAAVALLVARRTDHVMLVGEGALKFARAMGFKEENLLTEEAREMWLKWKANLGTGDDWLNDAEREDLAPARPPTGRVIPDSVMPPPGHPSDIAFTYGTVHVSGVTSNGHLSACTSTSGLSWKLPGRLGDSPIVGAGMYCDNNIGSAGATGRGEAVTQVCGSFSIVEHMDRGLTPTEACLAVLKRIADRTREKRLRDDKGRPNFNVTFYAVRKDGAFGSAGMHQGSTFAVHDARGARVLPSAFLFARD